MSLVETEALVLKSYNLSDADKIVVFFTRTHGLIRGVAKGAKRLKSKFGGSLEPFSVVHLTYRQKEERDLVYVNQIELTKSFFDQASDPKFLQEFGYLVDLLAEFAPPQERNENLYKMSLACLNSALESPNALSTIGFYFEFWILKLGGFLPNWKSCSGCKRDLGLNEEVKLQIDFRLLCDKCAEGKPLRVIEPEGREICLLAQRLSPQKFVEEVADRKKYLDDMSGILKRIISHVLDREIVGRRAFTIE